MPAPAVSGAEYHGKMRGLDVLEEVAVLMGRLWNDEENRAILERIENYIMTREGRVR